ncbi:uncharacterized protein Ecym_7258 [Eremothecium cymbalariae DBVPG|uniref:Major facilitator superfamily (MFS) profile domain-containing protein n=1 Tax=Eremothecium cymbalariae (strain CBS 270.75 / DBVPG 7215 / KCTC 17166 / NRRL Y-17582) TaxID=931890 RepID=G8JW87_ERECY|nr:hypothetical protein Ecym_7258 [Eremothecium cymbalariae DBVPG\
MVVSFLGIVQPGSEDHGLPELNVPGTFAMMQKGVDEVSVSVVKEDSGVDAGCGVAASGSRCSSVSGSSPLDSDMKGQESGGSDDHLKKTKKGIILNPQPSECKKDPLNWPIWRRDIALVCVGWHCFVGGGQTSMLASGFSKLSAELQVPLSQISYLVGPMMLSLGVGSIFASPTAVLFGKRLVYLVGILIFMIGSIGCACSTSFNWLLISRVVSGFGLSTVESLPSATIAEIYFAHERAYRLGIYTLLLLGGKNLVPLLGSLVFEHLSTHWLFWILTIIAGSNFVLHLLFVPETFWDRTPVPNKRSLHETRIARQVRGLSENVSIATVRSTRLNPRESAGHVNDDGVPVGLTDESNAQEAETGSKTRAHIKSISEKQMAIGLGIYHGRHTIDNWCMVMLRPFVLFSYPAILFGAWLYAYAVVSLIIISQVIDHAYKDIYGFSSASVGLVYIAPFIGGCLGSLIAGRGSDVNTRLLAAHNHGIYEPEFRLFMVLPAVLCNAIGLLGFGWSLERQDHWIIPSIFFGVLGFGSSMCSTTAITYAVDSYKEFSQEALVTLNMVKNILGFAVSFFNVKFCLHEGYKNAFTCYALIEIFIGLWAIPLYRWGKLCRSWTNRKNLLQFSYRVNDDGKDEKDNHTER